MSKLLPGFEQKKVKAGDVEINVEYGGRGEPILMLHGHPETHLMYHKIAPKLAERYTVVLPDLRGYGESSHPVGLPDHSNYSRRVMGNDQVSVMKALGFDSFYLMGHDRGARVAHRMVADHPSLIKKCIILDIVPTYDMYHQTDMAFANSYWHWFFLIQPKGIPERLVAGSYEEFLRSFMFDYSNPELSERLFPKEIKNEYIRLLGTPEAFHSICEDYRACATIDLEHDEADRDKPIQTPIHVLWGEKGTLPLFYDVLGEWQKRGPNITGCCVPNCTHFIPEDAPEFTIRETMNFFKL